MSRLSFCICLSLCPAPVLPLIHCFFCHHTLQKRIFFCVCVYLFVSKLKQLVRRERVQRVPYLDITTNNHIWTLGKALDGYEELWGCSGPSGDWNIEECKWNWATRWGFPLLFLPEGAEVSISWPAYQSYSLDTCPRLSQGILFNLRQQFRCNLQQPTASLYSPWHGVSFQALALGFLGHVTYTYILTIVLSVGQSILVGQISPCICCFQWTMAGWWSIPC